MEISMLHLRSGHLVTNWTWSHRGEGCSPLHMWQPRGLLGYCASFSQGGDWVGVRLLWGWYFPNDLSLANVSSPALLSSWECLSLNSMWQCSHVNRRWRADPSSCLFLVLLLFPFLRLPSGPSLGTRQVSSLVRHRHMDSWSGASPGSPELE